MRVRNLLGYCGVVLLIISCNGASTPHQSEGLEKVKSELDIIPFPNSCIVQGSPIDFSKGLYIVPAIQPSEIISASVERFIIQMRKLGISTSDPSGIKVDIKVTDSSAVILNNQIDEKYTLKIQKEGIYISCENFVGLNHAFSTLSQIAYQASSSGNLATVSIKDKPQFTWRGLMIDVVRHWIDKEVILSNIDAMAAAKMNILHLHLSDDQGWRVESKVFPRLHKEGSDGLYLTHSDIRDIVEYAYERGIRVVPEINMPGHITSWLVGYPDLASDKIDYELLDEYGIHKNLLDPTNEKTYTFIQLLLEEMAVLFPDEYVHVGGNEVIFDQWKTNAKIQSFIKENNFSNERQLQAYFFYKVQQILKSRNKKMIAWQDALSPELQNEGAVFQSWQNRGESVQTARLGFNAIHSEGWSLDHKLPIKDLYSVGPKTLPIYENLRIDSSRSQYWEFTTSFGDSLQSGALVLYGPDHNLNGVISLLNRSFLIENTKINNGQLSFQSKSSMGRVSTILDLTNPERISGNVQMEMMSLALNGNKVGGSDMPNGKVIPSFKTFEELSDQQEKRLLGGEACMWTEWVTSENIVSRIWPRTGAIAEKLWTDSQHTEDVDNFYKRSLPFSKFLKKVSLNFELNQNHFIERISDDIAKANFRTFIDLLEEVKYFGRFKNDMGHSQNDPLKGIADIVHPESMSSYRFGQLVNRLEDEGSDQELLADIKEQLDIWIPLYRSIDKTIQSNQLLEPIEVLALSLSDLAKIANHVIQSGTLTSEESIYYDQLKLNAQREINGVLLAPATHLIYLIDRYRTEL